LGTEGGRPGRPTQGFVFIHDLASAGFTIVHWVPFFTVDFCLCGAILNILTIPKFPEHVCLTACVGLPGLPPSVPK
jgi:hypothetical protein